MQALVHGGAVVMDGKSAKVQSATNKLAKLATLTIDLTPRRP